MGELVRAEDQDSIRILTVSRPEKLNALNASVLEDLGAAVASAESSPDLRCLIVTGAGEKAFIAGADIGELAKLSPLEGREHARRGQALFDRIAGLPVPTIAAINGFAYGEGSSWRWPAACAWPRRTPGWDCPRPRSEFCPDTAARSASPGSWVGRARWSSS